MTGGISQEMFRAGEDHKSISQRLLHNVGLRARTHTHTHTHPYTLSNVFTTTHTMHTNLTQMALRSKSYCINSIRDCGEGSEGNCHCSFGVFVPFFFSSHFIAKLHLVFTQGCYPPSEGGRIWLSDQCGFETHPWSCHSS